MEQLFVGCGFSNDKMIYTTKIKVTGKLVSPTILVMRQLASAIKETTDAIETAAKEKYLEQRKTDPSIPSMIIQSFDTTPTIIKDREVRRTVCAGGPKAYYAVWVDKGHTLRNGAWWSGYEFMDYGARVGKELAPIIIKKHLKTR